MIHVGKGPEQYLPLSCQGHQAVRLTGSRFVDSLAVSVYAEARDGFLHG